MEYPTSQTPLSSPCHCFHEKPVTNEKPPQTTQLKQPRPHHLQSIRYSSYFSNPKTIDQKYSMTMKNQTCFRQQSLISSFQSKPELEHSIHILALFIQIRASPPRLQSIPIFQLATSSYIQLILSSITRNMISKSIYHCDFKLIVLVIFTHIIP